MTVMLKLWPRGASRGEAYEVHVPVEVVCCDTNGFDL